MYYRRKYYGNSRILSNYLRFSARSPQNYKKALIDYRKNLDTKTLVVRKEIGNLLSDCFSYKLVTTEGITHM